ncbi:MAG: response regulator transcription factor [Bacteroidetes bacterium]|jgi:DNA-binding response OmpR family regulator|nr:response regulator transcription factor [Bacteroidota bacterium]
MRKHIVVIADDASNLEAIKALLEHKGYVVSALPAFSSMQELAFLRPDCFIIDEWLPEICGHAICLMLKAQAQTKNTPVILLSDMFADEHLENHCDADLILKTPFQPFNLLQIVSLLIKNSRLVHN